MNTCARMPHMRHEAKTQCAMTNSRCAMTESNDEKLTRNRLNEPFAIRLLPNNLYMRIIRFFNTKKKIHSRIPL